MLSNMKGIDIWYALKYLLLKGIGNTYAELVADVPSRYMYLGPMERSRALMTTNNI